MCRALSASTLYVSMAWCLMKRGHSFVFAFPILRCGCDCCHVLWRFRLPRLLIKMCRTEQSRKRKKENGPCKHIARISSCALLAWSIIWVRCPYGWVKLNENRCNRLLGGGGMALPVWVSRVCTSRFSEDMYFEGEEGETVSINYWNLHRIARYVFKEITILFIWMPLSKVLYSWNWKDHVHQALIYDI
jgi:hypothetical protein